MLGPEAKGWDPRPGYQDTEVGTYLVAMMFLLAFVPVILGESHRKLFIWSVMPD